ncbi:F0F1 ATP synthase subunit delta [Candidatus Marimicrobium litorale]|uniref:ATP synthase subunit delta n=1 Tax=Candidatus Marimicrobium litorale TaxID=2518991 RepID=A0ABT3T7G5_9GAMM|nr:F0F1 ATP synthase subunit delta [Candidatus Marimicrobium litorale]MCX2978216.1 F0F1 ATP synthase subunit delta [Candidatus Marimicrobium litorale]
MAELSTLARPYAKAAFEYALEKSVLAEWAAQLTTLSAVVEHESMAQVLVNPELTNEQQASTLSDVCGENIGAELKNFISILAANKRLTLVPEIHKQFELYKANQEKSVDVEVISAFELPEETVTQLASALGQKLARQVKVSSSTDSDLLGGVLIRAGDTVIDGSVRGRLNKLAEAMNS